MAKGPRIREKKIRKFTGEFKPHEFPEGFAMVIDTREQTPLFKKPPKGLMIKRDTLKNGDYSIVGFEDVFAVERKNPSDFLGYITHGRDKAVEKLKRLKEYEFKALMIECDEDALYFGNLYSNVHPEAIRQSLISFQVRYGVHVYFSDDIKRLERLLLDLAIKFYMVKKAV